MMIPYESPFTHDELRPEGNALVSPAGENFPIVNGIPRFFERRAEAYTRSFGVQWKLYTLTQLDSHTGTRLSRDRLERCMGHELERFAGKTVLEAGCGAGRFTELLVRAGALTHAIDASVAVEANADNVGAVDNYRIAQASLLDIPYPDESFDYVVCLGVLQHTESPEASVRALYRKVKPGGTLVIDHYRHSWTTYFTSAFVSRQILKRVPPSTSHRIIENMVSVLFPLHRAMRDKPRPVRQLFRRFSPVLEYLNEYPELSEEHQFEFAKLDTFDSLTDSYKHLRTTKQIARLLESLGMAEPTVWKGGNGVEARAMKPVGVAHVGGGEPPRPGGAAAGPPRAATETDPAPATPGRADERGNVDD